MKEVKIIGASFGGGRKENITLAELTFYPEDKRWFLTSLYQIKDKDHYKSNTELLNTLRAHKPTSFVVDIPVTKPVCSNCKLECPGMERCPVISFKESRDRIFSLLEEDRTRIWKNPKDYERKRVNKDKSVLSRSFKNRLKKGLVPYWNRPLDLWIWETYYDDWLKFFKSSYDSFSRLPAPHVSRFDYLKKHFPKKLKILESHPHVVLLELWKSKLIPQKILYQAKSFVEEGESRLELLSILEKELNIFVYKEDSYLLAENPKAMDSLLLALAGFSDYHKLTHKLPNFLRDEMKFVSPKFL